MKRLLPCLVLLGLLAAPAWSEPPAVLKIHLIGVGEYEPAKSLAEFKQYLEQNYRVQCTASLGGNSKHLDNLDALKSAELLVIFARRMNLPEEQMAIIRDHWEKGKPIVALAFNGRPLSIRNLAEKAATIFECWYLGQETGQAIAETLLGDTNPGGTLTITRWVFDGLRLVSLAQAACAKRGWDVRDLRGHPCHGRKSHGVHGARGLSRLGLEITSRDSDCLCAGMPGAAGQLHGSIVVSTEHGGGARAHDSAG